MSIKGLYKTGTVNSYRVNLEEVLEDKSLPFSYLVDDNKERYYQDFINKNSIRLWEKKKETPNIIPINEATRSELLKGADKARVNRAKHLTCKYIGVTGARGWIKFQTNSQYTPSLKYTQYIKLNEAKDMKYFKEFNKRDVIRLFLSGDLSVWCSCPDFLYKGYKYMGKQMGYGIFRENRFPKIRNPKLEGTVCKHLIAVLTVLNNNWMSIAKDMQRSKFFKKRFEELEDEDI